MYDFNNDYVTIKNDILRISSSNDSALIERLKKIYESEINSNRLFTKIINVQGLITILEKRDFLNGSNINGLAKIKSLLEQNFNGQIANDKNLQGNSFPPYNNNIKMGTLPRINSGAHSIASTSHISLNQSSNSRISRYDVKRKVYKIIATEIGKNWVDFGRILKVKEHSLDELSTNYKRIEDRVYKILDFHEEECDPRYWKSKLLDGLVEARRKDLKKRVQDIFDIHNAYV